MQFFRKFRSCTSNNQSFTFLGLVRDNVVISINILDNENNPKQFAVQPSPPAPQHISKPGGFSPNPVNPGVLFQLQTRQLPKPGGMYICSHIPQFISLLMVVLDIFAFLQILFSKKQNYQISAHIRSISAYIRSLHIVM